MKEMMVRWMNRLTAPSSWRGEHFSVVRVILGAYLASHFGALIPWGAEMFSSQGAIPIGAHSPLMGAFPNLFALCDSSWVVLAALVVGVVASVGLAIGWRRRAMALLLWYIWAALLGRNPLILNPGIPYVGWMLLCFAAIPSGEKWSVDSTKNKDKSDIWHLSQGYLFAAWVVMVLGYSYSGVMKLQSLSWLDGTAIEHVLHSPLAHDTWLRRWLVEQPMVLKVVTWGTLALEVFAAPIALFERARPLLWWSFIGLHVGILCTVDFADLTLGMLMIHLLTWGPSWRLTPTGAGRASPA